MEVIDSLSWEKGKYTYQHKHNIALNFRVSVLTFQNRNLWSLCQPAANIKLTATPPAKSMGFRARPIPLHQLSDLPFLTLSFLHSINKVIIIPPHRTNPAATTILSTQRKYVPPHPYNTTTARYFPLSLTSPEHCRIFAMLTRNGTIIVEYKRLLR